MSENPEKQPRRRQRKQVISVAQRRMARTRDLPKETKETFLRAVKAGLSDHKACDLAGINYRHFLDRRKHVMEYLEGGHTKEISDNTRSNLEMWAEFVEDIIRSRAEWELGLVEQSLSTGSDDKHTRHWVRNVTLLERRNREDWSRNEILTHSEAQLDPDERFL